MTFRPCFPFGARILGIVAPLLVVMPPRAMNPRSAPSLGTPALAEPAISPDRREIAFESGGDIWVVPASGGDAHLLVSHAAYDSCPMYSPDGTKLAFISTRTGNGDIYTLQLATGDLRRITFDDANDQLDAWSHDGHWLYFSSTSKDISAMNDVFRVSAEGGTPMIVSGDRYANEYWSAPSPVDTSVIAFTGKGRTSSDWWRHGHSHIDESEIWLLHDGPTPRYEQLVGGDEKDGWPMWSGDGKTVFYVSDRGGTPNIWSRAVTGAPPRQITAFTSGRVLWPSISYDGQTIVFERDFRIWSLDVTSGKASAVPIVLRGASASNASEHLSLTSGFGALAVSPDGKKLAWVARGDVFAASAKDGGEATRVTSTPEPETQLNWAPDSRRLLYVSARGGVTHLFVYDFASRVETQLTNGPANDVNPRWSPDGKLVAFERGARELRVIDPGTRQERALATGFFTRPPFVGDRALAWSPDGKWIAYLSAASQQFQNAYVVPSAGGESHQVSFLPDVFGSAIAWSSDGTYLLLDTSQRTEDGQVARVDLVPKTPQFREDQFRDLFVQPPRPGAPPESSPLQTGSARDSSRGDSTHAAGAGRMNAVTPVFDDIRQRVSILPIGVDVNSILISPDGKTLLMSASAAGQQNLYTYPLEELTTQPRVARQLTSTTGFKANAQFTGDSKDVYYLENGRINDVNVESRQVRTVTATVEMDIDFDQQKMEVFQQAWGVLRDNFFDPKMNGVDWNAVHAEYEPLVASAHTTEELRRTLKLMVGELNASHSGVNGPSYSPQSVVGRLGVRFDRVEYETRGRLRVSEVFALSPAALGGIAVGDYLVSVDGAAIGPHVNLDSLLLYKIDKRVALQVAKSGDGSGAREVAVRPVSGAAEKDLVYRTWVESRRAYVAKVSNGRLGYVHMPDMGQGSLTNLYLSLDTDNRSRDGVIIDIRNNNGGFVNAYALDVFARRPYLNMTYRDFTPSAARSVLGQRSLEKPTVLVTNMHSLSDAEDFTEGYRAMRLGPVIGEPTAGWIIYTSDVGLVDGTTTVRMPFIRITDSQGNDMEMHPRPVDVRVDRPIGESYSGKDSQLDAAVAELLKRLR